MTLGVPETRSGSLTTAHHPKDSTEHHGPTEVTAEVREVFSKLYAAWDDNDAGAFAALYRDDATLSCRRSCTATGPRSATRWPRACADH